jgi:ParB family chromosome partitioning protein
MPNRHSADIFDIAPEDIRVIPGFNYRDISTPAVQAKIREGANTMLNPAVRFIRSKPLTLKKIDGEMCLIDGHCRLEMVKLANSEGAGIVSVPYLLEPRGTDEIDRAYTMFSTGTPLSVLDKVRGVKDLLGRGQTIEDIAARLGVSATTVNSWLDLAEAPAEIVQAVTGGEISATEANRIVKVNGSHAGEVLAAARDVARADGRERVRPRDVAKVSQGRAEPVSVHTLALAVAAAWREANNGMTTELRYALCALADRIG